METTATDWEPTIHTVVDEYFAPALPPTAEEYTPPDAESVHELEKIACVQPLQRDETMLYLLAGAVFGAALVYAFSKPPVINFLDA
jgi:hypothetical protein